VSYFQVDISRIALDRRLLGSARHAHEKEILFQFESLTGSHSELNLRAVESMQAVWLPILDAFRTFAAEIGERGFLPGFFKTPQTIETRGAL